MHPNLLVRQEEFNDATEHVAGAQHYSESISYNSAVERNPHLQRPHLFKTGEKRWEETGETPDLVLSHQHT